MIGRILNFWKNLGRRLKQHLKQWTKPATAILVTETLSDVTRSRADLIAENAMLRQQLIVLNRQIKRPQFTNGDRIRLVLLARCTRFWRQALHIVQPDTLLRWHRDLFRRYWRRKSKHKKRKPRIAPETIALIRRMAKENRLWGAERIRGELLKLGIEVSKRTVQKYMPKVRRNSSQTWATFLKNHAAGIWACDFTVVHDLLFRPLYIFVLIELQTRRIVHTAVTRSPADGWTAQQLREATPWGEAPKYLIRDRDDKYGALFSNVAKSTGIQVLETPIRTPQADVLKIRAILRTLHRQPQTGMPRSHAHSTFLPVAPHRPGVRGLLQPLQTPSGHRAARARLVSSRLSPIIGPDHRDAGVGGSASRLFSCR